MGRPGRLIINVMKSDDNIYIFKLISDAGTVLDGEFIIK
jgi:hypothetical protein